MNTDTSTGWFDMISLKQRFLDGPGLDDYILQEVSRRLDKEFLTLDSIYRIPEEPESTLQKLKKSNFKSKGIVRY